MLQCCYRIALYAPDSNLHVIVLTAELQLTWSTLQAILAHSKKLNSTQLPSFCWVESGVVTTALSNVTTTLLAKLIKWWRLTTPVKTPALLTALLVFLLT